MCVPNIIQGSTYLHTPSNSWQAHLQTPIFSRNIPNYTHCLLHEHLTVSYTQTDYTHTGTQRNTHNQECSSQLHAGRLHAHRHVGKHTQLRVQRWPDTVHHCKVMYSQPTAQRGRGTAMGGEGGGGGNVGSMWAIATDRKHHRANRTNKGQLGQLRTYMMKYTHRYELVCKLKKSQELLIQI